MGGGLQQGWGRQRIPKSLLCCLGGGKLGGITHFLPVLCEIELQGKSCLSLCRCALTLLSSAQPVSQFLLLFGKLAYPPLGL